MCPCGSQKLIEKCCGQFLSGTQKPSTAEELMRSRYTAFVKGEIRYLKKTSTGKALLEFNEDEATQWSCKSEWLGLRILTTKMGKNDDSKGVIEFIATYRYKNQTYEHHEKSLFEKDSDGFWFFIDSDSTAIEVDNYSRQSKTASFDKGKSIGRNDPCICGSGKKYKKCCGESLV